MMSRVKFMIVLLGLASCQKQDLPLYHGSQSLYFVKPWAGNTAYSFVQNGTLATTEEQLNIPIVMIGGLEERDTPVSYQIEIESDNLELIGEEGTGKIVQVGYFDEKQISDTLYLNIARIPALADTNLLVRAKLTVAAPYNVVVEGADKVGLLRELDIIIDDVFPYSAYWQTAEPYLGAFSSKKMRVLSQEFINRYNGNATWSRIQEIFNSLVIERRAREMGEMLYQFLEEQKRLGTPVLERNGEEMKAGPLMYE